MFYCSLSYASYLILSTPWWNQWGRYCHHSNLVDKEAEIYRGPGTCLELQRELWSTQYLAFVAAPSSWVPGPPEHLSSYEIKNVACPGHSQVFVSPNMWFSLTLLFLAPHPPRDTISISGCSWCQRYLQPLFTSLPRLSHNSFPAPRERFSFPCTYS